MIRLITNNECRMTELMTRSHPSVIRYSEIRLFVIC